MKYCYNCNHETTADPLYCNFCGRSYDRKICPRRHANPRNAEACSRCGSRDLSTPQPMIPAWVPLAEFLVRVIPGTFLALASLRSIPLFASEVIGTAGMRRAAAILALALEALWLAWTQLPHVLRTAVYRMLKRKRESN
jgi:hypothetical protein